MRFDSLFVSNLRAIETFEVEDLPDFIVIAGQNGSGKSCVFDAVRLLKSLYGGYSANEYHQWFGEFAINFQDRRSVTSLLRDPAADLQISAKLRFSEREVQYLRTSATDLVLPIAWQLVTGQSIDSWSFNPISVATQLEQLRPQIEPRVAELAASLISEISEGIIDLEVRIDPSGEISLSSSRAAEVAFSTYSPGSLGVIEYHSASRTYVRQGVAGVTLDVRSFEDQRRQSGLYNTQAKYQNIKSELASGYVRGLIAQRAGEDSGVGDLNETLIELFRTFFPDKDYLGVQAGADGSLEFPVRLRNGRKHDIDDLSSGEKEILYGYLRLRNSTPRGSILLLDEPELHLNPGLLHGFADFYYRNLGVAQDNQIWLVTHSDALLRQAVGNSNYRVYHMSPASPDDSGANQAVEVHLADELEKATVDLVGDLATYRPHSKVIILEGDGPDGFDVTVVRRLFPEIARRANLVSGGNKARVRGLYQLLSESVRQLIPDNRFFAITDKDRSPVVAHGGHFSWDSYHIENYLLVPSAIRSATAALTGRAEFTTDDEVQRALHQCATHLVGRLALERVQDSLNRMVMSAIEIGAGRDGRNAPTQLEASLRASATRVQKLAADTTATSINDRLTEAKAELTSFLDGDVWMQEFPGRLILKRFVADHVGVAYEPFRNLVLDRMVEAGIRPIGMASVLDSVMSQ